MKEKRGEREKVETRYSLISRLDAVFGLDELARSFFEDEVGALGVFREYEGAETGSQLVQTV